MKNVMICGDFHCGHAAGLTPPSKNDRPQKPQNEHCEEAHKSRLLLYKARAKLWDIFAREVKARPQPDLLVVNGDAIDGRGERSGGTELIATDRDDQANMAAEIIRFVKPKKLVLTFGTPYHTGQVEDYERIVKKESKVKDSVLKAHAYFKIGGVTFDCKHKIGSSSVPYGRSTAVNKENNWNLIWSEYKGIPRGDVFIRSHVHYYSFSGDSRKLMMTTPALQAQGSKYGARQCSGLVDWGFLWFECDKGSYSWESVIPTDAVKAQKVELLEL